MEGNSSILISFRPVPENEKPKLLDQFVTENIIKRLALVESLFDVLPTDSATDERIYKRPRPLDEHPIVRKFKLRKQAPYIRLAINH